MRSFDAIILGGGQAGNPLSQQLAERGWKVALVERQHLGGSCINYGCTPTKKMLASARIAQYARRSADFGIQTGEVKVDLAKIVQMKDELVQSRREGLVKGAEEHSNITLLRGEARFCGDHQLSVDGEEITAQKIFINTGAQPRVLSIEGIQDVPFLTNLNIMDLTELPEHLLIIGGGYIGLEFGQMFRRFGSQVTVIEHGSQIATHEDEDVAQTLQEALEKEGLKFILLAGVTRAEQVGDGQIRLTIQDSSGETRRLNGSHLLIAAGQVPNTQALDPRKTGVELDEKGYVKVNAYLETNVPGIYAMGDVTGGPKFTHISYNDYQIVYHNLFNEEKLSTKNRIVPYTLYTDPELGRVGMTEKEARKAGKNIKVGSIPMSYVSRAVERGETEGLMKVVIDCESEQILGAAVLSVEGGELIQTLMTLMLVQAPWTVFKGAVFIHPTLTEGFFSLMESVE